MSSITESNMSVSRLRTGQDFLSDLKRSPRSIYVDGDVTRVTGVVSVSTQVDPSDASKGLKTSQVPGVFLDSLSVMPFGAEEHRFSGLENTGSLLNPFNAVRALFRLVDRANDRPQAARKRTFVNVLLKARKPS